MMDANLSNLLLSYPELQGLPDNKVRCTLTGHEMPSNFETVSRFVQCPSFQRQKKLQDQLQKNQCYFEDRGSKLFCKITKRFVAKTGDEIESHISGRRFRTALARVNAVSENGSKMETGSVDDISQLIDESDGSEAIETFRDEDCTSSCSSLDEIEAVDNGKLYPELAVSDNDDDEVDSDYDFNAMDTELDTEMTSKRKGDNESFDELAQKRRRY